MIVGLAVTFAAGTCAAGDAYYGVSMFGGTQWHGDPIWYVAKNYDWWDVSVRPIVGVHKSDRWDLWLEGNLTYVALDDDPDSVELGATGMTSYDFVSGRSWSLFGELGVGLGWMSDTPDDHILGTGILGFFDYGVGVKFKSESGVVVKLGPRFHHRSSLFKDDAGMNTYGLMLSVAK
jgi:hypothetical protein